CICKAEAASVVAWVVCHRLVCLFFSSQVFRLSMVLVSSVISEKASIIKACVSIGAWCQNQLGLFDFQYMPISSEYTLVSFKDSKILFAVKISPFRYKTNAIRPLSYKGAVNQYFLIWPR